jgi:hypothetical protein
MNKELLSQLNQLSKQIDSLQLVVDKMNALKENSEVSYTLNAFAIDNNTGARINFTTNELIGYEIDFSSFPSLLSSLTESANTILSDKTKQFENEDLLLPKY